jgi:hypothetical protein
MEDYTKEQVAEELRLLFVGKRKRSRKVTERTYYLIALLYFKFEMKQEAIVKYTRFTSLSSVNYAKRLGCNYHKLKDPIFLKHIEDLSEKFPHEFTDKDTKVKVRKDRQITFSISHVARVRLQNYMKIKKFKTEGQAVTNLLHNVLRLWEE